MKPKRTYLSESELKLAASDDGILMRLMARCLAEAAKLERSSRTARQTRPLRDKLEDDLPPDAFGRWTEAELAALDAHDRGEAGASTSCPRRRPGRPAGSPRSGGEASASLSPCGSFTQPATARQREGAEKRLGGPRELQPRTPSKP